MRSPVAEHKTLERVELEDGLVAYRCPESAGHWIPAKSYWSWQKRLPDDADSEGMEPAVVELSEFDGVVKLCPESGTIMTRYRVGHGLEFRVDRSVTGGVWLDGGEWEALKARGNHKSLHLVFGTPWQNEVHDAASAAKFEDVMRKRLGDDLYDRLAVLRDELRDHPARPEALAMLQGR